MDKRFGRYNFMVWTRCLTELIKAPCTEIIQRATSTIDYDQRVEKLNHNPAASVAPVCPILRDLYQGNPLKSDTRMNS